MHDIKKYKAAWVKDFCIGIVQVVERLMIEPTDDAYVEMHIAVLLEVKMLLEVKLIIKKKAYKVTLSASQALAIKTLRQEYFEDNKTWFGNYLQTVSNDINKQFN
jgi:hypothetical protein